MVVNLALPSSISHQVFESSVISYGSESLYSLLHIAMLFESSVISYGSESSPVNG